jgi:sugar phosphate isomerase/epimerase
MNLCVENLYDYPQLKYIFDNIQDENLKVCFDCGHHNCLTPKAPLIKDLGYKVEVLHLHDNHGEIENGTGDEHLVLGMGTIDLENLAENFNFMKDDIVLCAEYRIAANLCNKEFFIDAKHSLDELEKKIIKHKNR